MEGRQPDPAPSPTNTAGLVAEIDAEMQGRRRGYADVRGELLFRCRDSLVTAASAQARIAALEARVAELEAAKWETRHADTMNDLVAMGLARDAAEARADRLAILGKRLSERLCEALERAYVTDPEWVKTEYPNGVSEKLVIDAVLQDQPK